MPMQGRRIGARSRLRTGNLMADDGTLADVVDPITPGSDPDDAAPSPPLIDIGISIGL